MRAADFRRAIEAGDLDGLRSALLQNSNLSNTTIVWGPKNDLHTDPLHYVCDCVGNEWIDGDRACEIVALLLEHGADIEGTQGRESPLIGAASLGAERVAGLLIDAEADLERTSVFGARALHWAAYVGLPSAVKKMIDAGADLEPKCTEFGATPLFWAVHGFGPRGPKNDDGQLAAAKALIQAGAQVDTSNRHGLSALDCSQRAESPAMHKLLSEDG